MGLMDMFSKVIVCPLCRTKGAKKTMMGGVKCPNSQCKKYDPQLIVSNDILLKPGAPTKNFSGNFDPGPGRIGIDYRNFQGENKTFYGDIRTLRASKDFFSLSIVPTGKRVTFNKKFVRNLSEIESAIDSLPKDYPVIRGKSVTVKYKNFEGKERIFQTDSSLLSSDEKRVILRLKTEGKKFYLKKNQITNFQEIEGLLS
ncbi:MAG: hypothetical protein HQL12_04805 [Candidatus Omnitrophica bacterium]|nr:hypothetical protein [Candidatus Omnitrophota bacterium]